jgi:hypothetical protein
VPNIPPILINEILTHTDPPLLDSIELHNPAAGAVNIGGWFLSDDAAQPKKFRVPNGTTIPAHGFVVFSEGSFNPEPGVFPSFALSSHGESLFLFSGDAATNLTGYSHSFDYGAAANGVSFGRYVISTGDEDWPALNAFTPGASNSSPRVGPVVINEISYHPASATMSSLNSSTSVRRLSRFMTPRFRRMPGSSTASATRSRTVLRLAPANTFCS